MKRKGNRAVAIILAFAMLWGQGGNYIYAAEEPKEIGYLVPEGFAKVEVSGNVTSTIRVTQNSVIVFTGDTTINVNSGNGILLDNGVTAELALCGHTVTVATSAIGQAGIRVPKDSTLIVKEGTAPDGTLDVTGGPGTSPEAGGNGRIGEVHYPSTIYSGGGGEGGAGGDAPGAGIGGNGSPGGKSVDWTDYVWGGEHGTEHGRKGKDGNSSELLPNGGNKSGDVFLFGQIVVNARGGELKPTTVTQARVPNEGEGSYVRWGGRVALHGAAGGSGGTAYGSPGIGSGGVGGGSGGAGGSGSIVWRKNGATFTTSYPGAGGGGGGQTGGIAGETGGTTGDIAKRATNAYNGTSHAGGVGGFSTRGTGIEGWPIFAGGDGGVGGASVNGYTQAEIGKTYVDSVATLNADTSAGSTNNAAANKVIKNNRYLLSEVDVVMENPEAIEYTGSAIEPKLSIKDKRGNTILSELNKNYTVSFENNIEAGTDTAKITFASSGGPDDENYLLVDGGPYTYYFSIKPNDDPISITKDDGVMSYTYGESFKATVAKNLHNKGKIVWSSVLDADHTGEAYGTSDTNTTTDIIPTKVGKLKLKVSIIQETKNANGCYNFVDLSATLANDIEIKQRDIEDGGISILPLKQYTYMGAQIQPHYTVEDGNTVIQYTTNKDTAHKELAEGADFELAYGQNLNVTDIGEVTIKGIGNYKGETKKTFTIEARDINSHEVGVHISNQVFTGKDIFAEPLLKISNNTLPSTDRTLAWDSHDQDGTTINTKKDLINVGKKRITITGTGNITGTRTIDFDIVPADIGAIDLDITAAKDVYFDAKEIESRPLLKYNGIILTEDGTAVDTTVPIINPNDYEIAFTDHKEAGVATITLTGMENFKGTKELDYQILPRPLYILPDAGQWKYYGAKDIFGYYQDEEHPTYQTYIRKLSDDCTKELKSADEDDKNLLFVKNNLPLSGYPIDLLGNLSRDGVDDVIANDKPNTTYKYTINNLKLSDATDDNYVAKLIDNQNYYKLESYLYDGPTIELEGTLGKNEWYVNKPALLRAPNGFNISKKDGMDASNPWSSQISYDDGDYSKEGVSYFVRVSKPGDPSDGAISSSLSKQFKQDTVYPTGNLIMNSDSFSALNPNADFDFYLNTDLNGMLVAKDGMSQISSKFYYISDKKMGQDELEGLTVPKEGDNIYNPIGGSTGIPIEYDGNTWIDASQFKMGIHIYNTQSKILYVRIEDNAGNITYLNGNGIVFDKDAPVLNAQYKQDNEWTIDEDVYISGNVYDETSGLKDRYVAYQIDNGALQIIDTKDITNGDFKINHVPDGNYNLTISAWDKANNQAAPITFHVMKDTKMPRIILEADTTTIATRQRITFKPDVGASEVAKLEVRLNEGEWTTIENGVLAAYYAQENGTYTFRVTNGAGVVSKESSITFTKIDPKEPIIDLTVTKANGDTVKDSDYVNSKIEILMKNAEKNLGDGTFEYKLDGGQWSELNENLDNEARLSLSESEGSHTLHFRITAQNKLTHEKEFKYSVDLTKPTVAGNITIQDAVEGGFLRMLSDIFKNKKQEVTMNATDGGSGVAFTQHYIVKGRDTQKTLPTEDKAIEKMVNGSWKDGKSCEVDKGSEYVVYFKVLDKAGNISYARSDRIVINDAPPEIEVTYEKEGEWDNSPQFDVYVWDENPGVDKVEYTVDGNQAISASEVFTVNNLNLADGEHTVVIGAWDKSGNTESRTVHIKQDTGKPNITANEGTKTDREIEIVVSASYVGPSGLAKILVSKNGQDFTDITEEIQRTGTYIADENGEFVFRAVTGAGETEDATVSISGFSATADDLEAVVSAKTADGKKYETGTWSNQDVEVQFSNNRANLTGLEYWLKKDGGTWEAVTGVNGYVILPVSDEAEHQYEFKVKLLSGSQEESKTVTFVVKIDKQAPDATMKIKDIPWNGTDAFTNGFTFNQYFNQSEYAEVSSEDVQSGIAETEIFVIKESELPNSFKGTTTASKIEELGKGRWQKNDKLILDPNDTYIAFGRVYDHAGNVKYVCSDGVVFDDINPSLTSDIDQINWYKDNTSIITFDTNDNLSDVKEVKYTINDGTEKTAVLDYGSFTISSSEFQNGINHIKIDVIDNAGNTLASEFIAKKDDEAPVITVADETTGTKLVTKHYLSVNASAGKSGLAKVEVKVPDGGEWTDITDTFKEGFIAEENGTYWFRAVSNSGVNATTSVTLGNISKDIPVITYIMTNADSTTYYEGEWKKESVKVQFTNENANQIVEKYLYRVDDGAYVELEEERDNSAIFESVEGRHTYTMKLVLNNGLESEEVSVTILIDAIAPEIRVNSDLSQWVKGSQELEVEVVEAESGIANDGYSFDNGFTWQSDNKAIIRANKLVGIVAKDEVANMSKTKAAVEKIDSLAPTVETFTQIGQEKAKERELEADITDFKDLTKAGGSGVKKAYIMTSYPYKDGEFEANPSKTFAMKIDDGTWITETPVTVPYNGTNDVWLVTEDNVDNISIYSTKVNNMIGSGDDEGNTDPPTPEDPTPEDPDKPDNPDNPVNPDNPDNSDNPVDPDNPNKPEENPGKPEEKPGKPEGNPGKPGSTNGNDTDKNIPTDGSVDDGGNTLGSVTKQITEKTEVTVLGEQAKQNPASSITKSDEDVKKLAELKDTLNDGDKGKEDTKKITKIEYICIFPWILVIAAIIWAVYLRIRYQRLKKSYEEEEEREED